MVYCSGVSMTMNFCRGPLWEPTFWGYKPPVLTECFENTVLVATPAVFVLLGGIVYLYMNRTSPGKRLPTTVIQIAKLVSSLFLLSMHAYGMYFAMTDHRSSLSDVTSEFLRALSLVMVIIIQIVDQNRGIGASAFLAMYWVILLTFETPIYYRLLLTVFGPSDTRLSLPADAEFCLWVICYPILWLQFVLSSFNDEKLLKQDGHRNRNPIYTASPLSTLVFEYFTEMIKKGYGKLLTMDDLPDSMDDIKTEYCHRLWKDTVDGYRAAGQKIGLLKSLWMTYWPTFLLASILEAIFVVTRLCAFLILNELILYLSSTEEPSWKGYTYATSIFIVYTCSALMVRWADYVVISLGLKLKNVLIACIVRKSLRITGTQLGKYTVGELVNLLSVDADKINQFSFYIGMIVGAPLHITLTTVLLWKFLGPSCLAGISVIIIMMPLSAAVGSLSRNVQTKQMDLKDTRLKYISEILSSIKIIKFYGWEWPFAQRVRSVRYEENVYLKQFAYLSAVLRFFWSMTPFLVSLLAFITYLYVNDVTMISANVAFVSLSLFNNMRFMLAVIPDIISNGVQTLVSARRIENFLEAEEMEDNIVGRQTGEGNTAKWENATMAWDGTAGEPVLQNINLSVKRGELVAIVGRVGSGKSSLITSMLGDLKLVRGSMDLTGSVAYVPQQAWIQNATIKQNILFSRQFNRHIYKQVLKQCCLETDLKILPGGEQTEIGEKGVNLSGGQKQRISLARAVYQDRDVYFLDDPLSAVDAHVGAALFKNVIGNTGVLKGKTRILVTNMLSVLPSVDRIVVLENGRIVEQGTYQELKQSTGGFADFLTEHTKEQEAKEETDNVLETPSHSTPTYQRSMSITSTDSSVQFFGETPNRRLVADEVMEVGSIKWSVYSRYLMKVGPVLVALTIFSYAGSRAFDVLCGVWLSEWTTDEDGHDESHYAQRSYRILVYGLLGLAYGILSLIGTASLANGTISAARKLHHNMMDSVLKAPMSFFDTTPLGRLLNRFGKDIDQLDIQLPVQANVFLDLLFQLIGLMILIAINMPIFIVISFPLLLTYFIFQRIYMRTVRQLKRMESVSRSPVYNHFSEGLNGLTSIRAYCAEDNFVVSSDYKTDLTQNCSYLLLVAKLWLGTRLDIVSNLFVLVANVLIIYGKDDLDAGLASYVVSYAMGASFAFNFIVHFASEVEAAIVASERIDEYCDITPEADWVIEPRPCDSWPDSGAVVFEDYSTRYRQGLDLVLKGVNLDIAPCEKVGVVGRTGAGKSSLTLSLFRIIEAASGRLVIDDEDVSKLGLHDLRTRLTIIPQDPVIFSGSLRMNLDPNEVHQDEELWLALEKAHIKDNFEAAGLGSEIAEGGNNLSVGQRQLICLARAILQKKKILVLDEATAAVDVETDALIQKTIRADFADCTIITIAHRLNTIMDSDRVIVMDFGKVVEEGAPQTLLEDPNSRFFKMAKEAGLVEEKS